MIIKRDNINNIDKNKKVDYHNMGDIGDIISSVTNDFNMELTADEISWEIM